MSQKSPLAPTPVMLVDAGADRTVGTFMTLRGVMGRGPNEQGELLVLLKVGTERETLAMSQTDKTLLRKLGGGPDPRQASSAKRETGRPAEDVALQAPPDRTGADRRESRRFLKKDVPTITEVRVGGRAFEITDVSRQGLLISGPMRMHLGQTLRLVAVLADGARVELKSKVARAFVTGLSGDGVTFGLGLRLADPLEWLELDEDAPGFDPAAHGNEWTVSEGSGLLVPSSTLEPDVEDPASDDGWSQV